MSNYPMPKTQALRVYLKLADKVIHPKDGIIKWEDLERFTNHHKNLEARLR